MSSQQSILAIPAFGIIAEHLDQVRKLISRQLSAPSNADAVDRLLKYVDSSDGKMIRPGLVLLSGAACGAVTDQHIHVGAVFELIHTATLLHDDVIDDGRTRRGRPTVNSRWGNESAVLVGDFLLSRVFRMSADLPRAAARAIADAAISVCDGELRQVSQRRNFQLNESQYIDIIANKSASLFSSCCYLGAELAKAGSTRAAALREFGLNAGIAFQITDDLLDVVGDETSMGKTLGTDLKNSKLTLPLIHLLGTTEDGLRSRVEAMLGDGADGRAELRDLLHSNGSLDYARDKSRQYIDKALRPLESIDQSEARTALGEIANFVGDRIA